MRFIILLLLLFLRTASAESNQVSVPQTTAILSKEVNSQVIKVKNYQESVAYVQANVYEVLIDSEGKESYIKIEKEKKDNGVIALPEKFIISPKGSSNVRLLYTGDNLENKDRYFKIRFTPIVKAQYFSKQNKKIDSHVFVSITSTTFAVVPKSNPNPNVQWTKIKNGLKVKNIGDSIALLQSCKICVKLNCSSESEKRLIKNREIEFKLNDEQINTGMEGSLSCNIYSLIESKFVKETISNGEIIN